MLVFTQICTYDKMIKLHEIKYIPNTHRHTQYRLKTGEIWIKFVSCIQGQLPGGDIECQLCKMVALEKTVLGGVISYNYVCL